MPLPSLSVARSGRPALVLLAVEAGFVVAWSSGFIGARMATDAGQPWTILAWRFALAAAAAALVAACVAARRSRAAPAAPGPAGRLGQAVGIGLLAQGVYIYGVFAATQAGVPSGLIALIAAAQPMLAAALGPAVAGERVDRRQALGIALGMAGVAVAVGSGGSAGSGPAAYPLAALALPVLSVVGLTAATLLQRRAGSSPGAGELAMQFGATAVAFAILAAAGPGGLSLGREALPALAWLVVFSTLGGYLGLWAVVARGGATRAATLITLTPGVTAVWAFAAFGDPIGVGLLAGLGLTMVGVLLARPAVSREDPAPPRSRSRSRSRRGRPAGRRRRPWRSGAPCAD